MRILTLLTITLITFGCSKIEKHKNKDNESFKNALLEKEKGNNEALNENVKYYGFINKFYFSNENECYIELYFNKDELNFDDYRKMVNFKDSVVYKDDENQRYRFPATLAQNYFDLRGLSKLEIFDDSNKFVAHADFVRVEYLDQNISSVFIAVYKTDKALKADNLYGISNFNSKFEPANFSITNDTILTQNLLTKLNEQKPYLGLKSSANHLHFNDSEKVLSIINSENFTYVVLTTSTDFKVLYKSPEYANFIAIQVIPISKNNFPYILTKNVKPESDVIWDELLYFDGVKYKESDRQRIK